ncbi:MAG: Ig-like domain-containing protein, partial [Terriglobia bacterium]
MTKEFSMRNVLRSGLISLFVALVAGGPLAYGGTAPSTTTLSSLLNPSTYGTYAMFQATVTNTFPCVGWGGRGVCPTPTGQVSFYNGGTLFATGTLSNGGTAVGTSALTVGSHSITATYGGDSNYASSTSNTVTQTVNKATPTITWSNPSAITYGTALGGTQLNASANVQGSFAYTPASGTV